MARPTLIAAAVMILLAAWPLATLRAAPELVVLEFKVKAGIARVEITRWKGRPVVMLLSREGKGKPRSAAQLRLVQLRKGRLRVAARWPMPRGLRWVEPVPLPGGDLAWLGLIGSSWYMAREQEDKLNWSLLCRCETLFSSGQGPLPFNSRFAQDLDQDGQVELLLPHWRGLMVYRLSADATTVTRIWRDHWQVSESYELKDDQLRLSTVFPRYVLRDANGDGVRDLIVIGNSNLQVTYHPRPGTVKVQPAYVHDARKLSEWRRLDLPPSLMAALERMQQGSYATKAIFREALADGAKKSREALADAAKKSQPALVGAEKKSPETKAWSGHMENLLRVAREDTKVIYSSRVTLPGLKKLSHKEKYKILSVEDMNGDGNLDLIHVKTTNKGRILDQKNQLRWYQGARRDGRLVFNQKPQVFFSEGPAIAELVHPQKSRGGLPMLVLATTEVGLMAIIRAFTFNEVTLDLFVYPWRDGKLLAPPPVSGNLDFEISGNGKKNRPKVVLADLDGDGKREFLFNMDTDTLTAFRGTEQGPDFKGTPLVTASVPLPERKNTILVEDLDGDGKEELVLWYKRAWEDKSVLRTLRVLRMIDKGESAGQGQ